jgi:hypothetical protein
MKQSDSINELAAAMAAAQAEMGGAVKDSANPFFKSKYADLTSVVKAIKEPFANHGLSYTQFPCAADGCVGVTTRLMHSSGQWLESEYMLPMVKNDPQAAGSAITYARRYALQAMAGIPTADDDAESAMLRGIPEKTLNDWIVELLPTITTIQTAIAEGELGIAAEAWAELTEEQKHAIWVAPSKGGPFTTQEREIMKSAEFKQAHYGEQAA